MLRTAKSNGCVFNGCEKTADFCGFSQHEQLI